MPVDRGDDHARSPIEAPHLTSGPWRLRPLAIGDAAFILSALTDPDMQRARSAQAPAGESEAADWIVRALRATKRGTYVAWVLIDRAEAEPVGLLVLQGVDRTAGVAEAGYYVAPAARRRGAATGALRSVADWGFVGLGLHRISLLHDVDNVASCCVALGAGFRVEGLLRRSRRRLDGGRCDEELHARLRDDAPTWS